MTTDSRLLILQLRVQQQQQPLETMVRQKQARGARQTILKPPSMRIPNPGLSSKNSPTSSPHPFGQVTRTIGGLVIGLFVLIISIVAFVNGGDHKSPSILRIAPESSTPETDEVTIVDVEAQTGQNGYVADVSSERQLLLSHPDHMAGYGAVPDKLGTAGEVKSGSDQDQTRPFMSKDSASSSGSIASPLTGDKLHAKTIDDDSGRTS